eukprot:COSAG01_NODE_3700_length_5780_cov_207.494631_3_plen_141_part_00
MCNVHHINNRYIRTRAAQTIIECLAIHRVLTTRHRLAPAVTPACRTLWQPPRVVQRGYQQPHPVTQNKTCQSSSTDQADFWFSVGTTSCRLQHLSTFAWNGKIDVGLFSTHVMQELEPFQMRTYAKPAIRLPRSCWHLKL